MGERLRLNAFKNVEEAAFRDKFEKILVERGGRIFWNEQSRGSAVDCRTAGNGGIQTLYVPYLGGVEHELLTSLGRELGGPWIALFVREGSLWEYQLYQRDECIDTFSVAPEYWDDTPSFVTMHSGNARLLAEVWGVPYERIHRYIVNWKLVEIDDDTSEFRLRGKAYPEDQFKYGDFNQVFDFLRALGGSDPLNLNAGAKAHALHPPG